MKTKVIIKKISENKRGSNTAQHLRHVVIGLLGEVVRYAGQAGQAGQVGQASYAGQARQIRVAS